MMSWFASRCGAVLAEIPYPRIDPVLLDFGKIKVRWYGVSYVLAFALAYFVLRRITKRGRWPVAYEKVADVLFWGVLGVFFGGRLGYILFYMLPFGEFEWSKVYKVWEGGMSFHGGLLGVLIAYGFYCRRNKIPFGDLCDGLAVATAPGLFTVRIANFINAELVGTVTDVPWAMRFPNYEMYGLHNWERARRPMMEHLRHPSQLYEALAEGLVLFALLWWLMLKRKVGGGRMMGWFLIGYGVFRFFIEFVREPDPQLGRYILGRFTQGQLLCTGMVILGAIVLWFCHIRGTRPKRYDPDTGNSLGWLKPTASDADEAAAGGA